MDAGAPPLTETEAAFREIGFRVLVTRSQLLGREWTLELCSPFWRLYVNKHPGAFVWMAGNRIPLAPGRLHLIPAWQSFSTGLDRPVTQNYIHFEFTQFPVALHRTVFARVFSLPLTGPLAHLVRCWEEGLQKPSSPWVRVTLASALVHLSMAEAMQRFAEGKRAFEWVSPSGRIRPALDHIAGHLSQPARNEILARLCGMSRGHFIKTFRQSLGMTPAQFALDRRISTGARLLLDTPQSLEEIAAATGFSDRFHFAKTFKRQLGESPARYRRAHARFAGFG